MGGRPGGRFTQFKVPRSAISDACTMNWAVQHVAIDRFWPNAVIVGKVREARGRHALHRDVAPSRPYPGWLFFGDDSRKFYRAPSLGRLRPCVPASTSSSS